jgi:hypothetical protein
MLLGGLALTVLITMVPMSATAGPVSICDGIAGNLILNCGFEATPIAPDAAVPVDWMGSQFTGFEAVTGSPVNSGSEAMRISNDEFQGGEPLFNGAAILSQSFTDIPLATYQFSFYVFNAAGAGDTSEQQFQAYWGTSAAPTAGTPVFADTGGGALDSAYTLETFSVIGTGSDSITFTAYNSPSYYYLDDVSLVETAGPPTGTPEPASFILLALGTGLAGLTRRRKRA